MLDWFFWPLALDTLYAISSILR